MQFSQYIFFSSQKTDPNHEDLPVEALSTGGDGAIFRQVFARARTNPTLPRVFGQDPQLLTSSREIWTIGRGGILRQGGIAYMGRIELYINSLLDLGNFSIFWDPLTWVFFHHHFSSHIFSISSHR